MSRLVLNNVNIYYAKDLRSHHSFIYFWDAMTEKEYKIKDLDDPLFLILQKQYHFSTTQIKRLSLFLMSHLSHVLLY